MAFVFKDDTFLEAFTYYICILSSYRRKRYAGGKAQKTEKSDKEKEQFFNRVVILAWKEKGAPEGKGQAFPVPV